MSSIARAARRASVAKPAPGGSRSAGSSAGPVLAGLLALFGFLGPLGLALVLVPGAAPLAPARVDEAVESFSGRAYDLAAIARGERPVPRLFLGRWPDDWDSISDPAVRKRDFVMIVLPLVLRENEAILANRARLLALEVRLAKGRTMSETQQAWIAELATAYELEPHQRKELRVRVDAVPPSLALAQAAIESGWGASRFAVEGNALFGEWTEQDDHSMVPVARDPGRTYAIRRFATLGQSIASYMRNLNTHRAYAGFRALRAKMRRQARPFTGPALAETLKAYSERGQDYVRTLRGLIEANDLDRLDRVALAGDAD